LGLSTPESWSITPREFDALIRVRNAWLKQERERWAFERMDFRNAHLNRDQFGNEKTWKLFDFMPDAQAERAADNKEKLAVMSMNAKLALMRKGEKSEGLPDWAVKKW
jgi:hypothetical protein